MHKKIILAMLLCTLFSSCMFNVTLNDGQNNDGNVQNEENISNNENRRDILSSVNISIESDIAVAKTINSRCPSKKSTNNKKQPYIGYTTENLNIRASPSTNADILDVLKFNDSVRYYIYNDEWAEIIFNNKSAYISRKYISDDKYKSVNYYIPKYNGFKSWMSYEKITNKSSKQYKLQQIAYTGKYGIRVVNGRFCVAIGTAFQTSIGTYVDLVLENDFIIPCIVSDIKDQKHTDSNNIFTVVGKTKNTICCTEFIVDVDNLNINIMNTGDISYADNNWESQVKEICVYDKRYNIQ